MYVTFLSDTCIVGSGFYRNFSPELSQRENTLYFVAVEGLFV